MARFFDEYIARPLLSKLPRWIRPNHLTFARAALVIPVILWRNTPWVAVSLLILSSVCDIMDGPLARIRLQTTEKGASYDALADKIFILGALFFACGSAVSHRASGAVLLLEILLTAMRYAKIRAKVTAKSNRWGAAKTWAQSFAIAFVLTQNPFLVTHGSRVAFSLAVAFAVLSLFYHFVDISRGVKS